MEVAELTLVERLRRAADSGDSDRGTSELMREAASRLAEGTSGEWRAEVIAQSQAAASLRQRLEGLLLGRGWRTSGNSQNPMFSKPGVDADFVGAVRHDLEQAEAALEEMQKRTEHFVIHSERRQKLIERISKVLDVKDSAKQRDMARSLLGEIRADLKQSLVEDAVAEMVAAEETDETAQLQRRRSPTGQE